MVEVLGSPCRGYRDNVSVACGFSAFQTDLSLNLFTTVKLLMVCEQNREMVLLVDKHLITLQRSHSLVTPPTATCGDLLRVPSLPRTPKRAAWTSTAQIGYFIVDFCFGVELLQLFSGRQFAFCTAVLVSGHKALYY